METWQMWVLVACVSAASPALVYACVRAMEYERLAPPQCELALGEDDGGDDRRRYLGLILGLAMAWVTVVVCWIWGLAP